MRFEAGQELPFYEVTAKNYGADHANRIHSDEGAVRYGFAGALVPGVAIYAYLIRPAIEALGLDLLECGDVAVNLVKPVYDGEVVRVNAKILVAEPASLSLELVNSSGVVCAIGSASLRRGPFPIDPSWYPTQPLPAGDHLREATVSSFPTGDVFGALEFTLDLQGEMAAFLDNVLETSPIYRGSDAVCHPALFVAWANEIFMRNIALGPWIHLKSLVRHCALPRDGERLSIRGKAIETYDRRGHEILGAALAVFGEADRPIADISHTAIIKLRESSR
jgi:hypothetical protein